MALIYDVSFDSTTRVLSLLDKAGNVISSCEVPSKGDPLTLTATVDNSSVKLTKVGTLSNTYEVNTGNGWTAYAFGTVINLNSGESCKWRCKSHPTTQSDPNYIQFVMTGKIEATGNLNSMLSSDFENLTSLSVYDYAFYKMFSGCTSITQAPSLPATTLAEYCYGYMFSGCTSITQAPELPATALAHHCYVGMFYNCTSLKQAPELPATALSGYCYYAMFYNCTSLTQAPELPATTLASNCYYQMFMSCSSLTQAPELPATALSGYCYYSMFRGCTSLTQASELPATTLASNCYYQMFSGCTSLKQAPELPATTLEDFCYDAMFYNCTSLTQAPELPATTLASNCYSAMFNRCTSLKQAPELPATTLAGRCYYQMFSGCTSLKQAPELPATTLEVSCYENMFNGCSNLNEVRVSATTTATDALTYWLYRVSRRGDFYCDPNATIFPTDSKSGIPSGWTRRDINLINALTLTATADNSSVKLTKIGTLDNTFEVDTGNGWTAYEFDTVIPLNAGQSCKWRCSAHPTTQSSSNYVKFVMTGMIEASGNCNSMLSSDFEDMTSLSEYNYAFGSLFNGCTALTKAPNLPATTIASYCYSSMFYGCTALTKAPNLPATTIASYCYSSMFYGCTALTIAPVLPAITLVNYCYSSMFYGCTSLTKAPYLPASTLADGCYRYLFGHCTNLAEVRIAATTTAYRPLDFWLKGVSATGDFYCDPNATIFPTGSESGIPANWTRHALSDYPSTP